MTKLSKILVVFIMFVSLGFLAISAAVLKGGPNWEAQTRELTDYVFTPPATPEGSWTVKQALTDEQVASTPTLVAAVTKAREQRTTEARTELQELQEQIQRTEARLKVSRELIALDVEALERRQQTLVDQLQRVREQIVQANAAIAEQTAATQAVRLEAEQRREEVFRAENRLQVLRDDRSAADAQLQALQDELVLVKDNLARMQRRRQRLAAQLGQPYEEGSNDPPAPPAPTSGE